MDPKTSDMLLRAEIAALAAERAEVWSDAAVLTQVEIETASMFDRGERAARTRASLVITCIDGFTLRGQCRECTAGFLVVRAGAMNTAVAFTHVQSIDGLPRAIAGASQSRGGLRSFLGALVDPVEVSLVSGARLIGHITDVARDHLGVRLPDGLVVTIATAAVVRIQWRS